MWSYIKRHLQSTILIITLITGFAVLGFASPWAGKAENAAAHEAIKQEQVSITNHLSNIDGKLDILIDWTKDKKVSKK